MNTCNPPVQSRPKGILLALLLVMLVCLALPLLGQPAEPGIGAAEATEFQQFFGDSGFLGDNLIPVLAILMSFGMPPLTIILLAVFIFRYKERQQRLYNERLQRFLEAGQPIPEELLRAEVSESSPAQHLNRGLTLLGLGIGLALCLGVLAGWKLASIALIPIAVGIAKLISWKMASRQD